jgi:hypothetical protein
VDGFAGKAEMLSDYLADLLREERRSGDPVAYAAIEEPIKVIPGGERHDLAGSYKANAGTAEIVGILHAMAGSACGILRQFSVPTRMVDVKVWRKSFLPRDTRPPVTVARGKTSKWWKDETLKHARYIADRDGFDVPNKDSADAVGIAHWLAANVAHMRAEDDLLRRIA